MSSTLQQLINKIKHDPSQINKIETILSLLMDQSSEQQQKLSTANQLSTVIIKFIQKLNPLKQNSTFSYIVNATVQLVKILLFYAAAGQFRQNWFEVVLKIYSLGCMKQQIQKVAASAILHQNYENYNLYKNADLVVSILDILINQKIENSFSKILKFLLELEHIEHFNFSSPQQNNKIQLKKKFQQILFKCLEQLQNSSIDQSLNIISLLKDKVFSKLSNPLALSQFLLSKFKTEDQNPTIQIQVLSCLFVLVGKYGLQLQSFYQSLEKIITKKRSYRLSLFKVKNSKKFLKLVEAAMRTSKAPFKRVLQFVQMLLQIIINQKSDISYWALSFILNLVKKHRQLQISIAHLPEIQMLKFHYSPKIRSLVKQLSKNLNKVQYLNIQDFAKVSSIKLQTKKLQEIIQKIESNQEQFQFKVPKIIDQL